MYQFILCKFYHYIISAHYPKAGLWSHLMSRTQNWGSNEAWVRLEWWPEWPNHDESNLEAFQRLKLQMCKFHMCGARALCAHVCLWALNVVFTHFWWALNGSHCVHKSNQGNPVESKSKAAHKALAMQEPNPQILPPPPVWQPKMMYRGMWSVPMA